MNDNWTFYKLGDSKEMKAFVPGNIQSDLLNAGKIKDPFLKLNEKDIEWIEKEEWMYKKHFNVSAIQLQSDAIYLNFAGLDTFAEVFLNGKSILETNNMFVQWKIAVKNVLKVGVNTLEVKFKSTYNIGKELASKSKITYPADNETGAVKISPFIRKAGYQFGWDFAPRVLTTGIWKDVSMHFVNSAFIEDIRVSNSIEGSNLATISSDITLSVLKAGKYSLKVQVEGKPNLSAQLLVDLVPGSQNLKLNFKIPSPELWWPNGSGAQKRYQLVYTLELRGKEISAKKFQLGLNKIEVVNEPDNLGQSFFFKVNGKPVFIKGANFVPISAMPNGKVDSAKLEFLFKSMKESHFNMIRIWGGGVYESDYFYDLADEYGIMVWQDFPFACTMYPSDQGFLKSVELEARQNIKRLRNRPSLAIWCGNNEIDVGWKNWGWQQKYGYDADDIKELEAGYEKIFKSLLPKLVAELDGDRFYFHSSPISNWGKLEEFSIGDNHHWGVYHGEQPFSSYQEKIPRFNSEFGFQSFPSWETLIYISGEKVDLDGDILKERQKSYKGNSLLTKYMNWYYKVPAAPSDYVYLTQLQQAEGMSLAILASRVSQPRNMGVLMWQLNDVWPAISWSAIEFNGKWKAAQYFIKKAFSPIALHMQGDANKLLFSIVSDLPTNQIVKIETWRYSFQGSKVKVLDKEILLGSASTSFPLNFSQALQNSEYLYSTLSINDKKIDEYFHYPSAVKDLELPINPSIKWELASADAEDNYLLTMSSDKLTKNILISIEGESNVHLSNNFFDMLPGKIYTVELKTKKKIEDIERVLKFNYVKNQMR